jgi:hypothetical protein
LTTSVKSAWILVIFETSQQFAPYPTAGRWNSRIASVLFQLEKENNVALQISWLSCKTQLIKASVLDFFSQNNFDESLFARFTECITFQIQRGAAKMRYARPFLDASSYVEGLILKATGKWISDQDGCDVVAASRHPALRPLTADSRPHLFWEWTAL